MLVDVAVTHSRYSYFESIPTYIVKKIQDSEVSRVFYSHSFGYFLLVLIYY